VDARKLSMALLIFLGIASFLIPVAVAQEISAAQQGVGDEGAISATPKFNADDEEIQRKLANAGVKMDSLSGRNFPKIDADKTALGDGEGPPGFIVGLIMVFGALTLLAAFGVYRGTRWAKPLGISVRSVDILSALPAYGAAVAAPLLAFVTVGITLSLVCIVALVKWQPQQTAKLAGA